MPEWLTKGFNTSPKPTVQKPELTYIGDKLPSPPDDTNRIVITIEELAQLSDKDFVTVWDIYGQVIKLRIAPPKKEEARPVKK